MRLTKEIYIELSKTMTDVDIGIKFGLSPRAIHAFKKVYDFPLIKIGKYDRKKMK